MEKDRDSRQNVVVGLSPTVPLAGLPATRSRPRPRSASRLRARFAVRVRLRRCERRQPQRSKVVLCCTHNFGRMLLHKLQCDSDGPAALPARAHALSERTVPTLRRRAAESGGDGGGSRQQELWQQTLQQQEELHGDDDGDDEEQQEQQQQRRRRRGGGDDDARG